MLPVILAAVGGYLVYDSLKSKKYADGGIMAKGGKMDEKYEVLSPDGFTIEFDKPYYTSKKKAYEAFDKWKKRYEGQGYYSSNNGRIPLDELENNMTIRKMADGGMTDGKSLGDSVSIYYLFRCDDENRPENMQTDESYSLDEYNQVYKLKAELDAKNINYDLVIERYDKDKEEVLSNDYIVRNNYKNEMADGGMMRRGGRTKAALTADKRYKALKAGRRVSEDGNVYYESRANRSDVSRRDKLADGGAISDSKISDFKNRIKDRYGKGGMYEENFTPEPNMKEINKAVSMFLDWTDSKQKKFNPKDTTNVAIVGDIMLYNRGEAFYNLGNEKIVKEVLKSVRR
jgi:hypothetical protein